MYEEEMESEYRKISVCERVVNKPLPVDACK